MKHAQAAAGTLAGRRQVSLELRGLHKHFGAVRAVDDVNLVTRPGEFVTLLGPSGSGKTTTLGLIAGFLAPSSGEILLDGRDLSGLPPHKRNIGVVFQNYLLFPHMTAFENVAFPLRRRKMAEGRIKTEVEGALDLVGLHGLGHRYPSELSGGQQQRVAVARGIVFGPPLLLMDEPLGALDRNLREDLQGEIKRIHRELGTTFVYVTHDQQEALALSDRIAVFRDGKIEQLGTPAEIYRTPRTVFVARFMGDSNIFTGVYTEANGRAALKGEQFTLRLTGGGANGSRASILVRPENISIRDEKGSSDENSLSGHVGDIVYLGPQSRLSVDVPGRGIVTVTASAAAAQSWARGTEVHLSWKIEDGVLLEDAVPAVEVAQEALP